MLECGMLDEAAKYLLLAVILCEKHLEIAIYQRLQLVMLGHLLEIYYYMEDYEQARKELIEASNQGDTEALLYLGMVYQAQKDISNARSMYQDYISKGDSPAKGYNGLALCDIAEGNYGDALTEISNGLPLSTTEEMQDLLYNEIVIYEKQLDFSTALQKAKEYLEIFPEDGNMEREMKFLQSRVGTTQ